MTTQVPSIQWSAAGISMPTTAKVLAGVQGDMNTAFGVTLNPALETPQGQLSSSWTAIITDKNSQIAEIVNQVNPDYATGRWQDAIGKIYFMSRIAGQGTTVTTTCNGAAGTVIPVGTLATDQNGNQFSVTSPGTIGSGGTAGVTFTAVNTGPTPVPTSMSIYQSISGWDSITVVSGVVGRDVETRAEFETRRRQSVAANSKGYTTSIQGAVLAVAGVLDCYTVENTQSTAQTIGGVSIAPNSVYVAVVGGTDADVANAIWQKKSLGCSYNGNTSVTVYDTSIGSEPYPQYAVKFQRPTDLPIYFDVTIAANSALPADIDTLIQTAIEDALSGADGGTPAKIGATLYASRFYAGIAGTSPYTSLISVKIGTSSGAATGDSQTVNIDQVPTFGAVTVTQQ